ncbi:MAG TPA: hypothetical protein VK654_10315, partial [Nitrospirota bacterium]|nr:hypothetical protein [Nitrospirota bacterium]
MPEDKQITITEQELADLGILDRSRALANVELLFTSLGPEGSFILGPSFLPELAQAADPDMALNNFERFVSSLPDI